ncbi:MAG TPA: hypothetical protein DEO91_16525 [Pseudomonas sp.]|nr:hypothetical protein [Pseudomonas sp.]
MRLSCRYDDKYRTIGVSTINALYVQSKISLLIRGRIARKIHMFSCARNQTYQRICLPLTEFR